MIYSDRNNFDTRHGGAFDRGSADSYYGRRANPHMYEGDTGSTRLIPVDEMTEEQRSDYLTGYAWNEECGDKKDWS